MKRGYPVIFLRNCDVDDSTVFWMEMTGDSLEQVHEQVGEFVMKSLQKWHEWKRMTGREPHIHIEPKLLPREHIDKLEVQTLLNDKRTKHSTD
jgi:hypothetical protein